MKNAGLVEAQSGIKIAASHINNLRYADNTTLIGEGNGSILARKIPWTEELSRLQSMGSQRVVHD